MVQGKTKEKLLFVIITIAVLGGVLMLTFKHESENDLVIFTALNSTEISFAGTYSSNGKPIVTCTNAIFYNSTDSIITSNFTVSNCEATLIDNFYNNTIVTVVYTGKPEDTAIRGTLMGLFISLLAAGMAGYYISDIT